MSIFLKANLFFCEIIVSYVSSVRPYLFKILKNKSLKDINDYLIREQEPRISNLQVCDPSEIFSSEINELFQKTLAELAERTRDVFVLSRINGKSNKEIADLKGISVKGVDYHIAIALKQLKK